MKDLEITFEKMLGELDIDQSKRDTVMWIEEQWSERLAELIEKFKSRAISEETYVEEVNDGILLSFDKIAIVLGKEDYEKLFDAKPGEGFVLVDILNLKKPHIQPNNEV